MTNVGVRSCMPKLISVLYEDDTIVLFDKPSGMLVTPTKNKTKNVLVDIVNQQHTKENAGKLHPCHRLDQGTSGVIIFAKGKKNQQLMMKLFQQGAVKKTYVAFVKGIVKNKTGVIKKYIQDSFQKRYAAKSRSKLAITKYQVVKYAKEFTVVEVEPETGRTNQIRIHFSQMGHPVLGERVYAFRKDFRVDMKRLALHCCQLSFRHPVSGKRVRVSTDWPESMEAFVQQNM